MFVNSLGLTKRESYLFYVPSQKYHILISLSLFFKVYLFILRERELVSEHTRRAGAGDPKQALCRQHRVQRKARVHELRVHGLS